MKHARLRLAEMRQQSAHALESSLIEAAPLILTPHIDDELNLKVPRYYSQIFVGVKIIQSS